MEFIPKYSNRMVGLMTESEFVEATCLAKSVVHQMEILSILMDTPTVLSVTIEQATMMLFTVKE